MLPPQICSPGLRRCQNGNIQKCSSGGLQWQDYVSCNKGCEISDTGSVKCFTEEPSLSNFFPGIISSFQNLGLISIIILIVLAVLVLVLWIFCLVDIFSSGNTGIWKILWVIIITLVVAIGIAVYLVIRKKSRMNRGAYSSSYPSYSGYSEESKKNEKKKKISGKDISPALTDYINAARKSKIDDAKIKKNLLAVGWAEDKVNEAFEYLG